MEEVCATESEQAAAGMAAVEFGIATVKECWVGIEEGGEFVSATAEDGEHAGHVVARVASCRQEDLDAGGEELGVARISLDDVVEGGAGNFAVAVGSAP